MKPSLKTKYAVVLLLLFASLFSFMPAVALADQQSQLGTTTISLSGQAIPFDTGNSTGTPTPATLNLNGEVQQVGDGEFNIQNLTGSLQIGSATYTVYNGQGNANQGVIWIVANTSSNVDDHQLVLNGNIQGNALTFLAPSSRLTTQFFLALNGEITMKDEQGSNMISNATVNPNGSNAPYTPFANTTLTQNSTTQENLTTSSANNNTEATDSTQTLNNMTMAQFTNENIPSITNTTLTQNSVQPQNPTGSSVNYNNVTTVVIRALNNVTTNQLTNQSISSSSSTPQVVTVTAIQQRYNQTTTIYVTQTVANSTTTQTVTQSNVTTTTVANATITVTNSTAAASSTP